MSRNENMGEAAMKITGLLPKISSLFNSDTFSDVEFLFKCDNGNTKKIYGHKLILALRSKVFASMFFDSKQSLCEVRLPASKESSFSHLLRFLYTDDVQFHTFEEAKEIYKLANEYAVEELVEMCIIYMLQETLTIENVLQIYECAIVQNMTFLLKDCQDFICSNTKLILESAHFSNASVKVVEEIVKLDDLTVSSELEVIGAVLKWGSEELKRNKMAPDEKHLRKCVDPLLKHMRFLTLSFSEFDYFIENFNIFTGYESSILTRKIYQSHSTVDFPESLCPISTKRGKKQSSKVILTNIAEHSTSTDQNCTTIRPFPKDQIVYYPTVTVSPSSVTSTSTHQNRTTIRPFPPDQIIYYPTVTVSPSSVTNSATRKSTAKISRSVSHSSSNAFDISDSKAEIFNAHESPKTVDKIYTVKKFSSNVANVSRFHLKQAKFVSSPNLVDERHFQPNVLNNSRIREFEFPLMESQSCLETSFPKDVKSSISFKMVAGNICLYGFELKIKNTSKPPEELVIDVDLRGFAKQTISHQFQKELKGDSIILEFPEKMKLLEGSKGVLDVSIDTLLLNLCGICDINKGYKLNIGLGFACEISLGSTQKLSEMANNYIFLISKLMYMPC